MFISDVLGFWGFSGKVMLFRLRGVGKRSVLNEKSAVSKNRRT